MNHWKEHYSFLRYYYRNDLRGSWTRISSSLSLNSLWTRNHSNMVWIPPLHPHSYHLTWSSCVVVLQRGQTDGGALGDGGSVWQHSVFPQSGSCFQLEVCSFDTSRQRMLRRWAVFSYLITWASKACSADLHTWKLSCYFAETCHQNVLD